jgi:hypothetical protein
MDILLRDMPEKLIVVILVLSSISRRTNQYATTTSATPRALEFPYKVLQALVDVIQAVAA